MGLDMYLNRRRYVQNWEHLSQKNVVTLTRGGVEVPLTNVSYITEQVGYWRKENAIHKFFVDLAGGMDECQEIPVTRADLADLRNRCLDVLADHTKAEALLPTESGFFFGSTEYDDWYFKGLQDTADLIAKLLAEPEDSPVAGEFFYQASW